MAAFRFIDRDGTDWMILPGLPADFPDGGEGHGPVAGLTFRSGAGEIRVLPRAAFPRRASARVRRPESADWEHLLRQAVVRSPA